MFDNGSFVDIYEHLRVLKGYSGASVELPELNWLEQLKDNPPFKAILLRFEDDVYQFLIPHYEKTVEVGKEVRLEIEQYLASN